MANLESSVKDIRRTRRRTAHNQAQRTRIESAVKNVRAAASADDARAALRQASTLLDRAAHAKLLHWRSAARQKSRLAAFVAKKFKPAAKA